MIMMYRSAPPAANRWASPMAPHQRGSAHDEGNADLAEALIGLRIDEIHREGHALISVLYDREIDETAHRAPGIERAFGERFSDHVLRWELLGPASIICAVVRPIPTIRRRHPERDAWIV